MIPVYKPWLTELETKYVTKAMNSGWISSKGDFIDRFEQAFCTRFGFKHAIAVNNGTSATHLAYIAAGIGPSDEVIVPNITFVVTANAAKYCGAKVVLCPTDSRFHIDAVDLERLITDKTKAIVITHLFGNPETNLRKIQQLCRKHNVALIEDACEALGSQFDGVGCGKFSTYAASFSFFGNKIITTGEGGMVVTNSDAVAEQVRLYKGQGQTDVYYHPVVGYNYRMTNLQAAIGLAQIERFDEIFQEKQRVYNRYAMHLGKQEDWMNKLTDVNVVGSNRWMIKLRVNARYAPELKSKGIETRPIFVPLNRMPPYRSDRADLEQGNYWVDSQLIFPSYPQLTDSEIDYICGQIKELK